jgi:4-amino-4-deoxy-L-arabinose transferase-like glycosyltransferase
MSLAARLKTRVKRFRPSAEWLIVPALALLVVLLRLPSLEQPFDNDSGAIAYHARLILRGEPLYGTHHPTHHMPAAYYLYALAFFLLGDSVWAVKFLLMVWMVVSTCLLYWLGRVLVDRATGVLAAVMYAVLSSHILLYGSTAKIELFANLPRIGAILVLMLLYTRRGPPSKYAWVGFLSAIAFLFKVVYLSSLVVTGFVLLAELLPARAAARPRRGSIARGAWVAAGFAAGILPVAGYFAWLGLLPRLALIFTLGLSYVELPTAEIAGPSSTLIYPFLGLAINNAVVLVLGLAGAAMAAGDLLRHVRARQGVPVAHISVVLWLILSILEASVAHVQFLYYYQLILPPLALLAAWFLLRVYRDIRERGQAWGKRAAPVMLILTLVMALSISAKQNWNHYASYVRYRLGTGTHDDFLFHGWFERLGPRFAQSQELADYIRDHTSAADYVYYWSGNVEFYYLADRRCPIDVIWPLYAEATGPYQRIFVPQTKYVIVGGSFYVPQPGWLDAELAKDYTLETVIADQQVYRRVDRGTGS